MMSPEFWAAMLGQTVIIITAIVAAFVKTERRITKVETKVEHIEAMETQREIMRMQQDERIGGISRALARLEGAHITCPYASPPPPPDK